MNGVTCWHLCTAIAHDREYSLAETARLEAEHRQQQERLETYKGVMAAQPTHYNEAEIARDAQRFAPRAFSLMR